MNDQLDSVLNPIRSAYERLVAPEVTYIKKELIDLQETADSHTWMPSEEIASIIPRWHQTQVISIDKEFDIVEMHRHLMSVKEIGLVIMGKNISRHTKPDCIVIVTEAIHYVIDPNDKERGIALLTNLTREPELVIWTTNGYQEADCLFHNYGIDLSNSRARCCSGLHMHLMRILRPFPARSNRMLSMYPRRALEKSRDVHRTIPSYEELCSIWLDIEASDLRYDQRKLIHLKVKPLSETARNLIRKRCCLVLDLARMLLKYIYREAHAMNSNIVHLLPEGFHGKNSEPMVRKLRDEIRESEAEKIANSQYFAHLNGIFPRPKAALKPENFTRLD